MKLLTAIGAGVLVTFATATDSRAAGTLNILCGVDEVWCAVMEKTYEARTGLAINMRFLPDVPTFAESGYPNYKWTAWAGLLAPAGTHISVVQEINRAVANVLNEPRIKTQLQQMGLSIRPMSVAQFESLLRDDWLQTSNQLLRIKGSLD